MSICSPALLYLIFAIIAIISMIFSKVSASTIAIKGLFALIWTWFLNFLCSKGHEGVSWFLVILPFVFLALVIIVMGNVLSNAIKQNINNNNN